MGKFFMDLNDGDIGFSFGEFGVNSKGDPLMRVGDNMITNINTGEVHFVDSWDDESDDFLDDDWDDPLDDDLDDPLDDDFGDSLGDDFGGSWDDDF